jgi:luciferase family oxidoreductase group 1
MRLSVLHLEPPERVSELAQRLEDWGYDRFWATEHHSASQSASPTLVAAVAASHTKRIRVGSAGVLLQLNSPAKVVADFRLLELLFPGRVDLGVAGAIPAGPIGDALLDGRPPVPYESRVTELARLLRGGPAEERALQGAQIGPMVPSVPIIWLCGTSARSARLAGELGLAYAFHHYQGHSAKNDGPSVVREYVFSFRPCEAQPEPRFSVACFGICAQTVDAARAIWFDVVGSGGKVADFCGDASSCRAQLAAIGESYRTDEIVVHSCARRYEDRLESYRLLAPRGPAIDTQPGLGVS